ncbi:MAG: hypothetical protein GF421_12425 [Candidatus Aminicenantes bacterium]|nr:hypothetical protein [Candidatus Aminicenantes bacterium]
MKCRNSHLLNKKKSTLVCVLIILVFPLFLMGSIRFTDVTQEYNVAGYSYFGGHGVCWVDVNSDGKLDLYIKNEGAQGQGIVNNILYINYGDSFLDEALSRGVADAYFRGTHGAVFADLDSDKDFDLFSTTTYGGVSPSHNHIYENDGTGYFEDITNQISPSQDTDTASRGVAAADFDNDGDLDLYFSNPLSEINAMSSQPSSPQELKNFYMNNGDGTFTWMFRGIKWSGFVQGVSAVDIDRDGDIDIAEARWAPPSTIYLNDGSGFFYDAGIGFGLPQTIDVRDNGMTFGDTDSDGDLDLVVIGHHGIDLYKNRQGIFHMESSMSTAGNQPSFHCCLGDLDHDGDLDLYESGGYIYENNGQGGFALVSLNVGALMASLNTVDPRASALGDYDGDGDLDIYLTDKGGYNVLLRNDVDDSNWIQIEILSDEMGGTGGLGAKLSLYRTGHVGEPGFLVGYREITGEYGYLAQDMPAVHFGVSQNSQYDLKIEFINGAQRTLTNISPGQKIQTGYILPPADLEGERKQNRALFYQENVIQLTWNVNPDNQNVVKYRIYQIEQWRKFEYMDEVNADVLVYNVRNTSPETQYTFAVTAVNSSDIQGVPAYVIVE